MKLPEPRLVQSYPLRCLVRAPGSVPHNGSPPLLCFLHGYGEAAPLDIFDALTRHGPLRADNPESCTEEFVIVAPQLPIAGDIWNRYAEVVHQLVLDQSKYFRCARLYLTGFSFGANGVFDLSLLQRNFWAAVWPVDPTRGPMKQIATPIWLSLGEISRYQAGGFIKRLELEAATTKPAGDRLWSDDGEDHVGTARLAFRDKRIYQWLLRNRPTGQPLTE
jgi:predicted peptidase